ncbi:MAG TPA: MFS transporter [Azospirillaceae bacterium]|nr:MFS transporter [Azospirillaceae bacterium]
MWLLHQGRNALLLFAAQALFWTGMTIAVTLTGLIGHNLAPDKALATLPAAFMTIGNILAARPVSMFMQRHGRRAGFSAGALAGMAGGLIMALAVYRADFTLLCVGTVALGAYMAAAQYYRLAAVDGVDQPHRGRAVSLVMAGGIAAALAGPTLALWTKDLMLPHLYVGSYLALAALALLTLAPVAFLRSHEPAADAALGGGRPLGEIIRQPVFLAALANAAVGHGVMILVMHATPIAMVACSLTLADAGTVIQWHVLGMFAPSFVTGRLIDRYGAPRVAVTGTSILAASATVAVWGTTLGHFQASLLLLGVGWNLMYVAGTTLLAAAHRPEERGRVQGFAEMIVAGTAAAASFASGSLLNVLGWNAVNLGMAPLLAVALVITLWYVVGRRAMARA